MGKERRKLSNNLINQYYVCLYIKVLIIKLMVELLPSFLLLFSVRACAFFYLYNVAFVEVCH